MNKHKLSSLIESVKRCHYDARLGMLMFRKHHPDLEISPEDYAIAVGVGRTPLPNIKGLPEGPFPVYKDRPYFDARKIETEEQRAWEAEMKTIE